MRSLAITICSLLVFCTSALAQPGGSRHGTITVRKHDTNLEERENLEENQMTNLSIWDGPVHHCFTFNFRYYTYLSLGPSYMHVFKLSKNTAILTGVNASFLMEDSAHSIGIPLEFHFNNKPPIIKNFSYGIDFNRFKKFDTHSFTISPKIGFKLMGSPLSVWFGRNLNVGRNEIATINRNHITLRYNVFF